MASVLPHQAAPGRFQLSLSSKGCQLTGASAELTPAKALLEEGRVKAGLRPFLAIDREGKARTSRRPLTSGRNRLQEERDMAARRGVARVAIEPGVEPPLNAANGEQPRALSFLCPVVLQSAAGPPLPLQGRRVASGQVPVRGSSRGWAMPPGECMCSELLAAGAAAAAALR